MDSSLGFRVISTGRTSANMDDGEVSDGASTGFEIQGSPPDLPRTSSTISVDSASFHTADGLESDYPRDYAISSAEYTGDNLSSRLLKQGAQYFSANEGDSDSCDDSERSTLRADHYVTDPDQPKLALADDSVQPTQKHPLPQADEYRGSEYRRGNHQSHVPSERSPLLSSRERDDGESTSCCTVL